MHNNRYKLCKCIYQCTTVVHEKGAIMSGGHFDYKQTYLGYIAEEIEEDIKYNDISFDNSIHDEDGEEHSGYQLKPETINFMEDIVIQLTKLESILREYDLAISGDTSEETFQKRVGISKLV
jgi:hypothetical protein